MKALSKTNIVLNSVIELGVDILEGVKDIDDVIDVNEDILDESKAECAEPFPETIRDTKSVEKRLENGKKQ